MNRIPSSAITSASCRWTPAIVEPPAAANHRGSAPPPPWISSVSPRWRPGHIRKPFFRASAPRLNNADEPSSHLLPATSQPPPIGSKIVPVRTPRASVAASTAKSLLFSTPPSTATKAPQPLPNPEPANSNPPPTNPTTRPPVAPPWEHTSHGHETPPTNSSTPWTCVRVRQQDDSSPNAAEGAAALPMSHTC